MRAVTVIPMLPAGAAVVGDLLALKRVPLRTAAILAASGYQMHSKPPCRGRGLGPFASRRSYCDALWVGQFC